uniref:Putative secreted protein n=1 Tax=Ixodes ricinus TaxID=34613 RepID=A0A147BEM5_IXORI
MELPKVKAAPPPAAIPATCSLCFFFFVWVETTFGGNLEATTWPCIRYPVRLPNLTAFWRQIIPHSLKERVIGLPPWVKHVRCQEMQLVLYKEKKNLEMSHLQKIVGNFVRDYDLVLLVGCDTVFMFCPCWLTVA